MEGMYLGEGLQVLVDHGNCVLVRTIQVLRTKQAINLDMYLQDQTSGSYIPRSLIKLSAAIDCSICFTRARNRTTPAQLCCDAAFFSAVVFSTHIGDSCDL